MNFSKSIFINCSRSTLINAIRYFAKKDTGAVSMLGGVLKKKKLGKLGPVMEKKVLPVETDANRLVTYCCGSNILKIGEDVRIKPDSEYPDWLWDLRTGQPPKLEELDPNEKAYWRKLRKLAMQRNNKFAQLKKILIYLINNDQT